jgi:hypothetical protein
MAGADMLSRDGAGCHGGGGGGGATGEQSVGAASGSAVSAGASELKERIARRNAAAEAALHPDRGYVPLPVITLQDQKDDALCDALLRLMGGDAGSVTKENWPENVGITYGTASKHAKYGDFALDRHGRVCRRDHRRGNLLRLVVPLAKRDATWAAAHHEVGHAGTLAMDRHLGAYAWWPAWSVDSRRHTAGCQACQAMKVQTAHLGRGELHANTPCSRLGERVHVDVGTLAAKHFAVVVDAYSGYTVAWEQNDLSAVPFTDAVERHWMLHFGAPNVIYSDNGGENGLLDMTTTAARWAKGQIRHRRSAPQRPQTNGLAERAVAMIKERIRVMMTAEGERDHSKWTEYLQRAVFAINIAPNAVTGVAPFRAVFGFNARTPLSMMVSDQDDGGDDDGGGHGATKEEVEQSDTARERIREHIAAKRRDAKPREKQNYDQQRRAAAKLDVGDIVTELVCDTMRRSQSAKKGKVRSADLMRRCAGIYTVLELRDNGTVRLHDPETGDDFEDNVDRLRKWNPPTAPAIERKPRNAPSTEEAKKEAAAPFLAAEAENERAAHMKEGAHTRAKSKKADAKKVTFLANIPPTGESIARRHRRGVVGAPVKL